MFTIKFYSSDGCRQIIEQADSFTVLRGPVGKPSVVGNADAEITLHRKNGDDRRIDIGDDCKMTRPDGWPPIFAKAIIENAAGKTTEIIGSNAPYHAKAAQVTTGVTPDSVTKRRNTATP